MTYSEEYHWRRASRWAGYKTFEEFEKLDGEVQAGIVAEYETEMQITAVVSQYGK